MATKPTKASSVVFEGSIPAIFRKFRWQIVNRFLVDAINIQSVPAFLFVSAAADNAVFRDINDLDELCTCEFATPP